MGRRRAWICITYTATLRARSLDLASERRLVADSERTSQTDKADWWAAHFVELVMKTVMGAVQQAVLFRPG